ncbi:MAG TPA: prenyltransferase/squalene oxidase repeat-containing protein [Phycisphaerae bacterium]|jgi:hypothetical protein
MSFPGKIFAGVLAAFALMGGAGTAHADDEGGGIPREIEAAVDHGLEWLSKTQQRDGQWNAGGGAGGATAAASGLATMAFMARGHVPGQGPYGSVINKGVDAILADQNANGVIAAVSSNGQMYEHGICTVALCEVYGMLDDDRQGKARVAIAKAVRVILDAQNPSGRPKNANDMGGWRYTPNSTDSDISVTGWQLMALRGASNAGANIPQKAIQDGIDYIKRRAVYGGGFSYNTNSGPNAARSGTGVLALSLMGQPDAPEVRAGGDFLLHAQDVTSGDGHYYYTVYYCSQAAWQLGGTYWAALNNTISASIRSKQRGDGSWGGGESSDAYCTAMAILALTVPYRYLPIYQR